MTVETGKFDAWVHFYFDKNNKTTHLNATQSAISAYGYNPEAEYSTACVTGHRNVRKVKSLASIYGEEQGMGFKEMIDFAIKQMREVKSESAQLGWWDRLWELLYAGNEKEVMFMERQSLNQAIEENIAKYR